MYYEKSNLPTPEKAAINQQNAEKNKEAAKGLRELAQETGNQEYIKMAEQREATAAKQETIARQQAAEADKEAAAASNKSGGEDQRKATCPICSDKAKVKDKSAGKYIINLNLFFTKVVIRIPKIFDFLPKTVTFDENLRKGEKCGACEGKKKIPDVTDDSAKYQQAAQQMEAAMPNIIKQEAKLGLGGRRQTIVQGNDTLQVGLLVNSNFGYRVEKDAEVVVDGNVNTAAKGAPQQNGGKCNKVVPVPGELGWPSSIGNYKIQCGNSFILESGGGGISLNTKGNLTLKGGITNITAPQITLGCEQGPLTIGADSINITGRYINVAPTAGKFYVKGAIHSSGNIIASGHTHSESISFVKAACCGTNQTSTMDQGNKDVSQTQNAVWGGMGYNAIISSLLDIQMFYADIPMDIKNAAFRLLSPAEITNTIDRMKVLGKMMYPIESDITGICITPAGPGIVYNFPHTHGLQPMQHTHNTRVPDIDYSADSPGALRGKVLHGGTEGNAPGEAVRDSLTKKIQALMELISSLFSFVKQLPETISSSIRLS